MAKIHGLIGKPKTRRHREHLSAAGRAFWQRVREALAQQQQDSHRASAE